MPNDLNSATTFVEARDVLRGENWSNDTEEMAKAMVDYANQCIAELTKMKPWESCRFCVNKSCVVLVKKCNHQPRFVPVERT